MNDVGEFPGGKFEVPQFAFPQGDRRLGGKMRSLAAKCLRIAREADEPRFQIKLLIGKSKSLQQPAAEKTGPTRDENSPSTNLLPHIACVQENMLQILS